MSIRLSCDGCGVVLFVLGERSVGTSVLEARQLTVQGERLNDLVSGDFTRGQFHWCAQCASLAFKAVQNGFDEY